MRRSQPMLLTVLILAAGLVSAQPHRTPPLSQLFEDAVTLVDSRGNCQDAVPKFEQVAAGTDRALAARALVYLGSCYEQLGNEKARTAYRRVVEQYPDQRSAASQARARLAAMDKSGRASPRLNLRPLWAKRPEGLDIGGHPTVDGRWIPLSGVDNVLVVSDIDLTRRRPPVPIGAKTEHLPACTPNGELMVLSPDARQVAFTCEVSPDLEQLRVAHFDGSEYRERVLSADDPLEWSQPNSLLVQHGKELAMVNPSNGAGHTITALQAPVGSARTSPDGQWVVFDGPGADSPARHDVFVVESRGGQPAAVTSGPSDNMLPVWTPDGRAVLFVSDRTGSPGLWLQPVTTGRASGAAEVVMQDLGRVTDVWSASAGAFIYSRQTGFIKVVTVPLDNTGKPAGPAVAAETRQLGSTMMPSWSPDGSQLAYHTALTGARAIALGVKNLRTGDERQVVTGLPYPELPRWAPDGARIAVRGHDREGRYGLFLVDSTTGATTAVKIMPLMDEDTLGDYHWTADGALLAVIKNAFVRIDVATGREEQLFTIDGDVWRFTLLGSTGALAYIKRGQGSTTIELRRPGEPPRELLRAGADEGFRDLDWLPDGRGLLFSRVPKGQTGPGWSASLWRLDVDTAAVTPLGLTMAGLRNIAVSPTGRSVAFTTGFPVREPWVLENYLPPAFAGAARH